MNPLTPEQAGQIFPADCHFKIIAYQRDDVANRLNDVLLAFGFREPVQCGNPSSGGTYLTYNVSLSIDTVEQMREIDAAFRAVDGVRMVL